MACYGLAKALNGMGVDVLFVLPKPVVGSRLNVTNTGKQLPLPAETPRPRAVMQTLAMPAATAVEVQHAVEQAAAHAAEVEAADLRLEEFAPPVGGGIPAPAGYARRRHRRHMGVRHGRLSHLRKGPRRSRRCSGSRWFRWTRF